MEELEKSFDFSKRSSFDATKSLSRIRSSRYHRLKQPNRYSSWNRPAPDLTMQLYHPQPLPRNSNRYSSWNRPAPDLTMQLYHPQPLPRNSREAIQPWRYKASFDTAEVRLIGQYTK